MSLLQRFEAFIDAPELFSQLEKTERQLAEATEEKLGWAKIAAEETAAKVKLTTKYNEIQLLAEQLRIDLNGFKETDHQIINFDINRLKAELTFKEGKVTEYSTQLAELTDVLAEAQVTIGEQRESINVLLREVGILNRRHSDLLKARAKKSQ